MTELSRFLQLLTEEGFTLKFVDKNFKESKEHLEKFAYVSQVSSYILDCMHKITPKPVHWRDAFVYVYSFATQQEMDDAVSSLSCGAHYKYIRVFCAGVENVARKEGSIPEPDELVDPPKGPPRKKTSVEFMEERAAKRRRN